MNVYVLVTAFYLISSEILDSFYSIYIIFSNRPVVFIFFRIIQVFKYHFRQLKSVIKLVMKRKTDYYKI